MIKANELRIGNHIKRRRIDDVLTVDLELLTKVQRMPYLFEPIAFTEEWLLKRGFEKKHDDKWFCFVKDDEMFIESKPNKDGSFSVYIGSYKDSYNGSCCVADKKYIHQIQNLYFEISGEELKTTQ